jgi:hypothetical protein
MAVNPRRRHLGSIGREGEPMTIDVQVGLPPLPLPPHVRLIDAQGLPTVDYYQWQLKVHDWRLKLFKFLGGVV